MSEGDSPTLDAQPVDKSVDTDLVAGHDAGDTIQ